MTNRLAGESSPYLLQHKDNPVDWYPWGERAFEVARTSDRPVMLSIGYSTCHWCHVMAHESFEDPATAQLLNDHFVCIKVDREELPDVDALYMDAVMALTGRGGWPMTVFTTPDGEPFFGGTYFPKVSRGPMISFTELLERIIALWDGRRAEVLAQAAELTAAISVTPDPSPTGAGSIDDVSAWMVAAHDRANGGFGHAPKFPHPMLLDLALQIHARTGDPELLAIALRSATAMAAGGIYDHLGGGFSRYSVDARWDVPHFEKMLYDQALLLPLYTHLWQLTARVDLARVVDETVGYVLSELTHPEGGFYCAQDADSEGREGTYYLWSQQQVRSVLEPLGQDICDTALDWWHITARGNFEGRNVLRCDPQRPPMPPDGIPEARSALFEARSERIPPGLDDKVVTEWNALMVAALAEAATVFGRPAWADAAIRATEFALEHLTGPSGRLMRSWRGSARHLGYASDHAASLHSFLALARATGQARWVELARSMADTMVALFWDDSTGMLFSAGHDAPGLIHRVKDTTDTSLPSANSLAARSLASLATITGETRYRVLADRIIDALAPAALEQPMASAWLLSALESRNGPSTEIVITGERPDLLAAVNSLYLPSAAVLWGEPFESPLWVGRAPVGDEDGRAYVCQGYSCDLPCDDVDCLTARIARIGA